MTPNTSECHKQTPHANKTQQRTEQIEAARGPSAARVEYLVTFVDAQLRVTRCGRQVMVHRRCGW